MNDVRSGYAELQYGLSSDAPPPESLAASSGSSRRLVSGDYGARAPNSFRPICHLFQVSAIPSDIGLGQGGCCIMATTELLASNTRTSRTQYARLHLLLYVVIQV